MAPDDDITSGFDTNFLSISFFPATFLSIYFYFFNE